MVRAWFPRRRSHPMATQSLPTMATHAPPVLYVLDYCCRLRIARWKDGERMVVDWGGCGIVGLEVPFMLKGEDYGW